MITVASAVENTINTDELALETLRAGLLNLSAYADKIMPQIERVTMKTVQSGTIVVALSRIARNSNLKVASLTPNIKIENLNIRSSLASVTYIKTPDIARKIAVLYPFQISTMDVLSIIEGPTELTIVVSEKAKASIISKIDAEILSEKNDLVAVTVEFSEEYSNTPNFHYALFSALAKKRIKIIQTLSTHTELTFIIEKNDLEDAVSQLNVYFSK